VTEQASVRVHELGRLVDNYRHAGVKALWIKVIVRAVFDWVTYRHSDDIRHLKLAESARIWIFEPSELFNGFSNICFYLDLDPDTVRAWAVGVTPDQVVKIEHLEREPVPEGPTSYLVR
jgi:hypothetical protein